jgi:hypothetical protein
MTPDTARISREKRIAHKLITDAVAAGYLISVYEGEDWAIKRSHDGDAVKAALASTDEDVLRFRQADGALVGWVRLIWGNDCDLISDCSDNEAINELVKGAEALAAQLER